MPRTFIIGDVHGCSKTLMALLLDKIQLEEHDNIFFLGDYIDRGPDSKGVINFILQLKGQGYNIHTLRGNHEQLFMDSEKSFNDFQNWIVNGGTATMESFAISGFTDLENEYKKFFNETEFYFEQDGFLFVHAGFDFRSENIFDDKESMLWIRDMRVDKRKAGNKIIVHGHTPTPLEIVQKNLACVNEKGSLNIDTGCVMKSYSGYGYLSALELETMNLYSVRNVD